MPIRFGYGIPVAALGAGLIDSYTPRQARMGVFAPYSPQQESMLGPPDLMGYQPRRPTADMPPAIADFQRAGIGQPTTEPPLLSRENILAERRKAYEQHKLAKQRAYQLQHLPRVRSDVDWRRLRSGAVYIGPDGKIRRKK